MHGVVNTEDICSVYDTTQSQLNFMADKAEPTLWQVYYNVTQHVQSINQVLIPTPPPFHKPFALDSSFLALLLARSTTCEHFN